MTGVLMLAGVLRLAGVFEFSRQGNKATPYDHGDAHVRDKSDVSYYPGVYTVHMLYFYPFNIIPPGFARLSNALPSLLGERRPGRGEPSKTKLQKPCFQRADLIQFQIIN